MHRAEVFLVLADVDPHALLLEERKNVDVYQEQLGNSNVSTAIQRADIADESARVNVACHVGRSRTDEWNIVLDLERD